MCEHCRVRKAMQDKYVHEMMDLYAEDFNVVKIPLLTEEVRGSKKLSALSEYLIHPYQPPK